MSDPNANHAEHVRAYRAKHRAAGLCRNCPRRVAKGRSQCARCIRRVKARAAARARLRKLIDTIAVVAAIGAK